MPVKCYVGKATGRAKCRYCFEAIPIDEDIFLITWRQGTKQFHHACFKEKIILKILKSRKKITKNILVFLEKKPTPYAAVTKIGIKNPSKRAQCRICKNIIVEGNDVYFGIANDVSHFHFKCFEEKIKSYLADK